MGNSINCGDCGCKLPRYLYFKHIEDEVYVFYEIFQDEQNMASIALASSPGLNFGPTICSNKVVVYVKPGGQDNYICVPCCKNIKDRRLCNAIYTCCIKYNLGFRSIE